MRNGDYTVMQVDICNGLRRKLCDVAQVTDAPSAESDGNGAGDTGCRKAIGVNQLRLCCANQHCQVGTQLAQWKAHTCVVMRAPGEMANTKAAQFVCQLSVG